LLCERIYRYVYFRVADQNGRGYYLSNLLKVWESWNLQGGQSPLIAWLYRIAHNAVIDYYRSRKDTISLEDARPVAFSHADDVDEKLDLQIKSELLREALGELTDEQQRVLMLKFVGGMSTREIAEQLGKQQGAVALCRCARFKTGQMPQPAVGARLSTMNRSRPASFSMRTFA